MLAMLQLVSLSHLKLASWIHSSRLKIHQLATAAVGLTHTAAAYPTDCVSFSDIAVLQTYASEVCISITFAIALIVHFWQSQRERNNVSRRCHVKKDAALKAREAGVAGKGGEATV